MKDKNYEIVRQAVMKAVPEILELKFGCVINNVRQPNLPPIIAPIVMKTDHNEYVVSSDDFGVVGNYAEKDIEILGRPIRLADVLLAIGGGKPVHFCWSNDMGYFADEEDKLIAPWNLFKDSLEDQSEDTWKFLADLLA